MGSPLNDLVGRWVASVGIDPELAPTAGRAGDAGSAAGRTLPARRPTRARSTPGSAGTASRSPRALRAWLLLSDGFYLRRPADPPALGDRPDGPVRAGARPGGPARELVRAGQPRTSRPSASTWPTAGPGGDCPIFTSGDDQSRSPPRMIATELRGWFLELLHQGGREYWFDPGFADLGDPWVEHRAPHPRPPLPDRLRPLAPQVLALMRPGADDRSIASTPGDQPGRRRDDLPPPPARPGRLRRVAETGIAFDRSAKTALGQRSETTRLCIVSWHPPDPVRDRMADFLRDRRLVLPAPRRSRATRRWLAGLGVRDPERGFRDLRDLAAAGGGAGLAGPARRPAPRAPAPLPRPRHGADEPRAVRRRQPDARGDARDPGRTNPRTTEIAASSSSARASTSAS